MKIWWIGFAVVVLSLISPAKVAGDNTSVAPSVLCDTVNSKGARVDTHDRCRFFAHFESDDKKPDDRVIRNLRLQEGQSARSIALVVGISGYINKTYNLPAAAIDVAKLKDFLINQQHFDEVVVLTNRDATVANIRYFLRAYAYARANYYDGKVRFLFAYSGHGLQVASADDGSTAGAVKPSVGLVLADASDDSDVDNILGLNELRALFNDLARNDYQFLALINACFGGDVFGLARPGGSLFDATSRSADAITAGSDDHTVLSLGAGHGSLFFDTIIDGVESGEADSEARRVTLGNAKQPKEIAGIVRLGAIDGYLSSQMQTVVDNNPKDASALEGNNHHWTGPVTPDDMRSLGGFFFLWQAPKPSTTRVAVTTYLASLKVTNDFAPSLNQIVVQAIGTRDGFDQLRAIRGAVRGIDISHINGVLNWKAVAKSNIRFAYIKATESDRYRDPMFSVNWAGAGAAGLPRAAYHIYSFCTKSKDQFENIGQTIGGGENDLPIAVDVELYEGQASSTIRRLSMEGKCADTLGTAGIRKNVAELLDALQKTYGKKPVLYGNDYLLDHVLTSSFTHNYSLWRVRYGVSSNAPPAPWTMWQYTENENVPGIKGRVDVNILSVRPPLISDKPPGSNG